MSQLIFAPGSIWVLIWGVRSRAGPPGIVAITVVAVVAAAGPSVFGPDWFKEGYFAGLAVGPLAYESRNEKENLK